MKNKQFSTSWKMASIVILCIVGLLVIVFALRVAMAYTNPKNKQQINFPTATPMPAAKATPRTLVPVVGMTYQSFESICDERSFSLKDRTQTYDSDHGYSVVIYRHYTSERSRSMCFGTFTFHNEHLYSIYR